MQPSINTLYYGDLFASAYTQNEIFLPAYILSTLVSFTQYVIWLQKLISG